MPPVLLRCLVIGLVLAGLLPAGAAVGSSRKAEDGLPRFTEAREAAAVFFIKKHVPEILPLLEQLKKTNLPQYQHEIREVFLVTEMLADLQDDTRRHDLELKIWVTEHKARALVARLSTPNEAERKQAEARLQELARALVELDVLILELKAEQLDRELGEVKDELSKMREQTDREIRQRYEGLLDQARKKKR
jgi:hypothetical protein